MESKKITILCGDQRNLMLAKLLSEDGHKVMLYGFEEISEDENLIINNDFKSAIEFSNIIIGPVPFIGENEKLYTDNDKYALSIKNVFESLTKDQTLMGGYITEDYKSLGEKYPFKLIDFYERDEMRISNAIPTAEGVIQNAMGHMETTMHGSNIMVLGFGRVGKMLSKMLSGIGANVYTAARSHKDISWIKAYGYKPVLLNEIDKYFDEIDVIFNTIPHVSLDESMLKLLNKNTLIFDNASNPGGVDYEKAKEIGIKTFRLLGVPGETAPITAAQCIKDTVFNIIEEIGI